VPEPTSPPTQIPRLFPRDGTPAWQNVEIVGWRPNLFRDFYYFLLATPWPMVLLCFAGAYLFVNALFGAAYAFFGGVANAHPGSFSDGFFFSVETMGTIGYGEMTPQSRLAHLLVTAESMLSLLGLAVVTGLVFAKFSRPRARVLFSNVAVIAPRDGVPTFMFRVANERANHIVEAQLRVTLLAWERTLEGEQLRRMIDLPLARSQSSAFILTWTALHPIVPGSPFYGATQQSLVERAAEVLVSLTGLDGTTSQVIHARHSFVAQEIRWDERFVDIIEVLPSGKRRLHYSRFHDTEPLPPAAAGAPSAGPPLLSAVPPDASAGPSAGG
jgi:inward rectifier potassium channel